jgi:hypothetical protein
MKARLHHHAGSYSVLFDGKLLVEGSRDPECDAARALLARGYTGTLHMLDGKTGIPRTIIEIERAAKVTTKEGRHRPYSLEAGGGLGKGSGGERIVAQSPRNRLWLPGNSTSLFVARCN